MSCADLFCGEAKAEPLKLEFLELPKMERVLASRLRGGSSYFFSCQKFRMGSWLVNLGGAAREGKQDGIAS